MKNTLLLLTVFAMGCQVFKPTPEEQLKAAVEQAKIDQASEQKLTEDSIKFVKTFVIDSLYGKNVMLISYEDDNENMKVDSIFYIKSIPVNGHISKFCVVNKIRYDRLKFHGDTISCQWVDTLDGNQ